MRPKSTNGKSTWSVTMPFFMKIVQSWAQPCLAWTTTSLYYINFGYMLLILVDSNKRRLFTFDLMGRRFTVICQDESGIASYFYGKNAVLENHILCIELGVVCILTLVPDTWLGTARCDMKRCWIILGLPEAIKWIPNGGVKRSQTSAEESALKESLYSWNICHHVKWSSLLLK